MDRLFEEMKEEEEGYVIVGGDYNARTRSERGPIGTGEIKEETVRRFKDQVINKEGRMLVKKIKPSEKSHVDLRLLDV